VRCPMVTPGHVWSVFARRLAHAAWWVLPGTLGLTAQAYGDPTASAGGGEPLRARCAVLEPALLTCDYRLADPADVRAIQASVGSVALPPPTWEAYPTPRSMTAVLLLLDSSGSGKQLAAGQAVEDINVLLEAAPAHVRFGLATFDSELGLVAPIGESRTTIRDAARQVKPTERSTELYRNALEAIRLLAATPADRRALFIFSDGAAEDRAYFHQDVITAADGAGVVVSGCGYPRSPAQTVALQTLRRLSEETGGVFLAADASGRIRRELVPTALRGLDSGGSLRADLSPVLVGTLASQVRVRLTVHTSRGEASTQVPIDLPARVPRLTAGGGDLEPRTPPAGPAPGPSTVNSAQPPTTAAPAARPAPLGSPGTRDSTGSLLSYGIVVGVGTAAFIALRWGWWRRAPRRRAGPTPSGTPHAYLTFRDHPDRGRFAVAGQTVRIGRQRDNDLVLEDTSVSRHHAEIHHGPDGSLTLVDLDALNGVFVNERQVKSAVLGEGDSVEIGDVRFFFTRLPDGPNKPGRGTSHGMEETIVARPEDLLGQRGLE